MFITFTSFNEIRYPNRYIKLQMDLKEFYTLMQDFVKKDEFNTHIRKDGYDMDKIEEKLKLRKNDVMNTEYPIVIAGETSAGKSSVVNLILGEKILPSGIRASTSRLCRVKYGERLMICTRDNKDEELDNMSLANILPVLSKVKNNMHEMKFEIELCVQQVANCILTGSVRRGCGDPSLLQALLIKGVMQFTRLLYVSLTAKDAIGEQRKKF
uniref:Dynamin N-terminal domain-containing protein n=1 Tax=Magallana gigas TaxID=29159 RepID=K1QZS5_MAGGI